MLNDHSSKIVMSKCLKLWKTATFMHMSFPPTYTHTHTHTAKQTVGDSMSTLRLDFLLTFIGAIKSSLSIFYVL